MRKNRTRPPKYQKQMGKTEMHADAMVQKKYLFEDLVDLGIQLCFFNEINDDSGVLNGLVQRHQNIFKQTSRVGFVLFPRLKIGMFCNCFLHHPSSKSGIECKNIPIHFASYIITTSCTSDLCDCFKQVPAMRKHLWHITVLHG